MTLDASNSYFLDYKPGVDIVCLDVETTPSIPNVIDRPLDYNQAKSSVFEFTASIPGMYEFKLSYFAVLADRTELVDHAYVKKYFYEKPPLAVDAGYDALIPPNTAYKLVNNSFAQDTSNLIYSWDPPSYLDDPNVKEPIFTAPTDGDYTLKLTIEDGFGQIKSDTVIITAQSKRTPYASAGQHQEYELTENQAPFDITLDASSSFSYQGETLSFEWIGDSYISGPVSLHSSNSSITTYELILQTIAMKAN